MAADHIQQFRLWGSDVKDLQELVKRKNVRTADRAYMRAMLDKIQRGENLSYQEQVSLDAYLNRYARPDAPRG